jgi:hypothetical protein
MPGAQRAALGFSQSGASRIEVPTAATLSYVGTFSFACHEVNHWWPYVERECTKLEIRDERELALQVASATLGRLGTIQTVLAATLPAPSQTQGAKRRISP